SRSRETSVAEVSRLRLRVNHVLPLALGGAPDVLATPTPGDRTAGGGPRQSVPQLRRRSIMRKYLVGVLLALFLGLAGPAQADFVFTPIDPPGATFAEANFVNNLGQIVGDYQDAGGTLHGFRLSGGVYTPFDVPGSTSTSANAINASGQIVGIYFDAGG